MKHDGLLAYYTSPGAFTSVHGFEAPIDEIADDVEAVALAVQGLLLHEAWAPAYGVTLSNERRAEKELHGAIAMLNRAMSMDPRPLCEPRRPEHRVVGVCRHFATLFVAFLRHKDIPARARCGFAGYFETGKYGDHWVGEYWDHRLQRWVLVDEQLDELQRNVVKPAFSTLDVPRDQFIVAGDAWRMCRQGEADPMTFGVGSEDLWGLEEVMGQVFVDLASLRKVELLPWGWYGLAAQKGAWENELALIDRLASFSASADAPALEALGKLAVLDPRIALPAETIEETRKRELSQIGL